MSYCKGPDLQKSFSDFQAKTSVLNRLVDALGRNGDSTAMVEGQTGKTISSRQLLQQGSSIAAGLQEAGVTVGDYVVICCDKSITAYSVLLGVIFTGATAILYPIPHADIIHLMTKGFRVRAVFCDAPNLDTVKKSTSCMSPEPSLVVTTDPEDKMLSSLINCTNTFTLFKVKDSTKHIPMLFFSSGTTGDPKGILTTDNYVQLCGYYFDFKIKSFLIASPMYWVSSLTTFVSAVFNNYTVIWSNSTDVKENLALLHKYKVEGWCTSSGSLSLYANEPTIKDYDLSCLKYAAVGGEYVLSCKYNEFVSKVLGDRIILMNGYGSTEGGLMALLRTENLTEPFKTGLCGPLLPGVEAKILDDKGNLAPIGCLGEVLIRSLALTSGYWGRPDLNQKAFDKDGFLYTGDAGLLDEKGYLYLCGRFMDLINYKGTKISPAEVENVLMSHEGVLDVAVVGKPHPTDIQHSTAYVALKPGFCVTEKELKMFVDSKIDDVKKLRGGVYILDALPRTIIGKVKRKLLREM